MTADCFPEEELYDILAYIAIYYYYGTINM